MKNIKDNLSENTVVIHIDFSENYNCKYAKEVQAIHFGASHNQASLHTGILYMKEKTVPFCTISASGRHDPSGIWAHLDPIIDYLKQAYPKISNIHFFSDGPTTQYRNRKNIFLLGNIPYSKGFKEVTWHYSESGHGKGAPDGVGAAIKRSADSLVSKGTDIPDAKTLYLELSEKTSIMLFYIPEEDMDKKDKMYPDKLPGIPEMMKVHQIKIDEPGTGIIKSQLTSCNCESNSCQCKFNITQIPILSKDDLAQEINYEEFQRTQIFSVGSFCLVSYDQKLYPGEILSIDDSQFEIKTMNSAKPGMNRFMWPTTPDILWYMADDIYAQIEPPIPLSKRIFSLDSNAPS